MGGVSINMNLKKRKVSLTEIVILLLKPDNYVSNPFFPSVLKENTEIQAEFGADNVETYEYEYRGWTISFRPDQVMENEILEFKVKRPYTKEPELKDFAYIQGLLQAYMMGIPKFRVVIVYYNPSENAKKVESEVTYDVAEGEAVGYLDLATERLEKLRELLVPIKVGQR